MLVAGIICVAVGVGIVLFAGPLSRFDAEEFQRAADDEPRLRGLIPTDKRYWHGRTAISGAALIAIGALLILS